MDAVEDPVVERLADVREARKARPGREEAPAHTPVRRGLRRARRWQRRMLPARDAGVAAQAASRCCSPPVPRFPLASARVRRHVGC